MITVIAIMKAQQGKESLLAEEAKKVARQVRENEPGCLLYIPHTGTKDPAELIFVEKYSDQAAFDAHVGTAYLKAFTAQFRDLLEDKPVIKIMRELI